MGDQPVTRAEFGLNVAAKAMLDQMMALTAKIDNINISNRNNNIRNNNNNNNNNNRKYNNRNNLRTGEVNQLGFVVKTIELLRIRVLQR